MHWKKLKGEDVIQNNTKDRPCLNSRRGWFSSLVLWFSGGTADGRDEAPQGFRERRSRGVKIHQTVPQNDDKNVAWERRKEGIDGLDVNKENYKIIIDLRLDCFVNMHYWQMDTNHKFVYIFIYLFINYFHVFPLSLFYFSFHQISPYITTLTASLNDLEETNKWFY